MQSIMKRFGEVQAVRGASFDLMPGEIHSLIGENGAGKSTMMKLLYGMYAPDDGRIEIGGEPVKRLTPKAAIEKGVGMVHQEFQAGAGADGAGKHHSGFRAQKGHGHRREIRPVDGAGVHRSVRHGRADGQALSQISVGEAQRVEIIKILARGAKVLILDEPTAVLTPQEARRLFVILENLRKAGKSIVFISHRLGEVLQISDRMTVMRQGETVGTIARAEATYEKLARMMIGREVFLNVERQANEPGETVLKVDNLWTSGEKELSKIRGLSLGAGGEIVGIAGIDGNGQSELIEAITGLRRVERGSVRLWGAM
jgi:simple sugar transport system ATP-binding protein